MTTTTISLVQNATFATSALLALSAAPVFAQGAPQSLINQTQARHQPSNAFAANNQGPSELQILFGRLFGNGGQTQARGIGNATSG